MSRRRVASPIDVPRSGVSPAGVTPARTALQLGSLVVLVVVIALIFGTMQPRPEQTRPDEAAGSAASQPAGVTAPAVVPTVKQVSASFSQNGYQKVELGEIGYGQAAADVGLSVKPESRPRGPTSFGVDAAGTLYIGDDVNGRVQVYSKNGKHVSSISVDEQIRDLIADDPSSVYVLSSQGRLLAYEKSTGKAKGQWDLDEQIARGLGKLRLVGGGLSLESPQQATYPLARVEPAGLALLKSADQAKQQKKGAQARSSAYYSTSYRDGGHVFRYDDQGNLTQDIALGLPNVASVVFLDEDRAGSFYVQVESLPAAKTVDVEVWQFDRQGAVTTVIPLELSTYVEMVRSVVVAENGDVYQVVPSKQSLRVVKWQRP